MMDRPILVIFDESLEAENSSFPSIYLDDTNKSLDAFHLESQQFSIYEYVPPKGKGWMA